MERQVNLSRLFQNKITVFLLLIPLLNIYAQDIEVEHTQVQPTIKTDSSFNAEQIIEMTKPALISIWYHTNSYFSYYTYEPTDTTLLNGSGFFIDESGIIGTNYHVVDGIDSLLVKTSDGTFYDAEILIMDEKNDLAIIRIKNPESRKFPIVKLGNSNNVKVGQEVFAIGSPFGYEYTISQGIVAGIRDNEKVSFTDPVSYMPIEKKFSKVIQITAALSPGNSGGALFNNKGEVIGITTYTYQGYGNLNFAIAINSFVDFTNTIDLANLENNEESLKKINQSLFFSNLKLANSFKEQTTYNWYYVKQNDTMTVLDTFVVRQDSIARMDFAKAENFYLKCIMMEPDSFSVYQELMDLYVFTESFPKAESLYIDIREKFNDDSLLSQLSSTMASAYSGSKEYKKALQFYKKMLAKDTGDIYIYYQIADLYEQMGKYKRAVKEYKNVLKRDTNYTQAYVQLGKIYYEKLRDLKKAKFYLETANEKEILNYGYSYYGVDVHYYLGMIAVKEHRKMDAILSYLELKNIYTYTQEDNEKKLKLYKAIKNLD